MTPFPFPFFSPFLSLTTPRTPRTYWEHVDAFRAWIQSPEFREVEKSERRQKDFSGPNAFEKHESIQVSEKQYAISPAESFFESR